jgi:MFS family permease
VLYGIGALLSAVSPGLGVLILGNSVLEGVGTALLIPPVYILTTLRFSDLTSRARAFGVISGLGGLGAAAGPLIGGLITTAATVGVLASSLAAERLAKRRPQKTLIIAGFVVTMAGIGLLLALVGASSRVIAFAPGLLLIGLGLGVMLTPSVNLVQSSFPEEL